MISRTRHVDQAGEFRHLATGGSHKFPWLHSSTMVSASNVSHCIR